MVRLVKVKVRVANARRACRSYKAARKHVMFFPDFCEIGRINTQPQPLPPAPCKVIDMWGHVYAKSCTLACGRKTAFLKVFSRNVVRRAGGGPDPQNDIIRRVLYPGNIRNKETPTGTWRPDVARALKKAIPSKQAHETIERAWLLRERHERWRKEEESARKFECMKKAMDELEELDPVLYKEANRVEDPRKLTLKETEALKSTRGTEKKAMEGRLPGLFPRELRIPTDTPSRTGWDYNWKAPS